MCLILVSLVPIFVHVDGVAARPLARQQLILLMFPKPSHHTPYFYTEDTDMIQKRECTIFGWKTPDQISIQLLVKLWGTHFGYVLNTTLFVDLGQIETGQ